MRKYIKPESEVVELVMESQILAASGQSEPVIGNEAGDGIWRAPKRETTTIWGDDEDDF